MGERIDVLPYTEFSIDDEKEKVSEKIDLNLNVHKTKITASCLITSWQIDGETMETVTKFILGVAQKSLQMLTEAMKLRHLFFGRKAMTNLDSILKSRDIILHTNGHLVKAMVFPVVMYDLRVGL